MLYWIPEYMRRNIPLENLKERFERTTNTNYKNATRRKKLLNEENLFEIVSSIKEIGKNLDIGKSSVVK